MLFFLIAIPVRVCRPKYLLTFQHILRLQQLVNILGFLCLYMQSLLPPTKANVFARVCLSVC